MNKDRRNTCKILSDVCGSFAEEPANKVLFALKGSVDDLITKEQRSIERMAPHVEKTVTRINHDLACAAKHHLQLAAEALVDGDMEEAADQLLVVAENREDEEK